MMDLQFITHYTERYTYADSARMALEGGCRWIQLRMKHASEDEWMQVGLEVGRLCRQYGATFVLDDHVELVKPLSADGVHLGKQDMPIDEARRLLGSGYLIGGTANTFDDIRMHAGRGADYIGCGPFRFTTTKEKLSPVIGLDGYRSIMEDMKRHHISLPVIAIGGITKADIRELTHTGVTGIALSGSVLHASDPVAEMRNIISELEHTKE